MALNVNKINAILRTVRVVGLEPTMPFGNHTFTPSRDGMRNVFFTHPRNLAWGNIHSTGSL